MIHSAQPSAVEGRRRWLVLFILAVPLFMMLLDVTIVNIAIPHIMGAFNVGIASIEWVLNVYVLVFAVLLITMGKLGDLYGRKVLFISGLGLFTLASLMCGLSPSYQFLLVARGIQAVGAATMMPATLSILNVVFGERGRGLALGIWGAVAGAANALGPVIGGLLVDAYSWHWIFLVNLPVGIAAFVAAIWIVRESTDPRAKRRVDIPGVITASLALFCLTFALVEGQGYGWTSATILGLFAVSALSFIAFILIERRSSAPLVPLKLFRNRTFSAGNGVGLIITFGLIGVIFLLVLFLQIIQGFSAIKAGLTILPLPILMMAVAPLAGRFTDKIGGRWFLFSGMLCSALAIYLMSDLSASTGWQDLVLPLAVSGLGIGLVMAPVTTVVMASAPLEQSGSAAGILTTMRQIGAVLGISVLGAILQNQLVSNLTAALSRFPQIPQLIQDRILEGLTSGRLGAGFNIPDIPAAFREQLLLMFHEQFAHSLNTTMKVAIFVCIAGAVVALLVSYHVQKQK